jgi:hypothetical protein
MALFKQAAGILTAALMIPLVITLATTATSSMAASAATSSIYDSISTLVGSLSNSVNRSSNGSSNAGGVAGGEYKLLEVATASELPGMVHLKMQALAAKNDGPANAELILTLPLTAFEKSGLVAGDLIAAKARTYGMEFANAKNKAAFFLVLNDEVYRELVSNPVAL